MKFVQRRKVRQCRFVTPLVGVWIEISTWLSTCLILPVTPLVGVWIEMLEQQQLRFLVDVTPLVGVWIEMTMGNTDQVHAVSHSPCESVD